MRNSPLRGSRYWQLLFLFTAMVMILTVVVALYSLSRVSQTYDAMERALQFVMSVRTTHTAIQAVEISERDYLLWKNEDALKVYRDSVTVVANEMQKIHSIESDIHAFELVTHFESLLLQRLKVDSIEELDFPYAGIPTAAVSWDVPKSAAILQSIRSAVQAIETSHAELLEKRRAELIQGERNISIALALVSALGALGLILMYRILQRSLSQQARWEAELLTQKQELEDRVAERTAALQQNSRELERSNRELEDFAFVASHDLQEPLRKILAFGDRLKERSAAALGDNVDYLNRMQSAARRMSMLIHDLLEFSRVTSKPRAFETVSLDKILANVLEDLEESIASRGAIVRADPLPDIDADSTQMHQLFQNLIGNAIKFVAEGERPEVRITAHVICPSSAPGTSNHQEYLELHVIDNGIGFDPEYAERIFKPFQRLHSRNEYSGTGIGLALCRRIAERHNGTLTASSEAGHGADFTVILPIKYDFPGDDLDLDYHSLNPTAQENERHAR